MKEPLDLSKYSIRTDLAVEAHQMLQESQEEQKDTGSYCKEREEEGTIITKVTIDEAASEAMGKKPGNYLTLEVQGIRQQDTELQQKVERIFAKEFSNFLEEVGVTKEASCLIVGLGNWNVTPDALGPIVVENVLVTRHLFQLQPESVEEGFRPVSAIRPG